MILTAAQTNYLRFRFETKSLEVNTVEVDGSERGSSFLSMDSIIVFFSFVIWKLKQTERVVNCELKCSKKGIKENRNSKVKYNIIKIEIDKQAISDRRKFIESKRGCDEEGKTNTSSAVAETVNVCCVEFVVVNVTRENTGCVCRLHIFTE